MTNALPKDRALSTYFTSFWHLTFSVIDDSRKKYLYHTWDQKPTPLLFQTFWAAIDCKDILFSTVPSRK